MFETFFYHYYCLVDGVEYPVPEGVFIEKDGPIPGLDGSRLVFGIVEVIRRKPVPPEKEAVVHLVGMVFLFGLMIFFTFKDIMKLFG